MIDPIYSGRLLVHHLALNVKLEACPLTRASGSDRNCSHSAVLISARCCVYTDLAVQLLFNSPCSRSKLAHDRSSTLQLGTAFQVLPRREVACWYIQTSINRLLLNLATKETSFCHLCLCSQGPALHPNRPGGPPLRGAEQSRQVSKFQIWKYSIKPMMFYFHWLPALFPTRL